MPDPSNPACRSTGPPSEDLKRADAKRLERLVESATAGLVIHAPDGSVRMCNAAARELLGLSGAEIMGKTWSEVAWRVLREDGSAMPPEEFPVAQVLARGRPIEELVAGFQPPRSQEIVWVLINAVPVLDDAGLIRDVVVSFMDITERARAREDLQRLNESLEARVAERTAEAEHRAEQLRALAAELVQAEQGERRRLALVLHDHLQQLLVGAQYSVGALKGKLRSKAQHEAAAQLSETLAEAIKTSRSLTSELSPPVLHEHGLAAGLEWLGRHMHEKHGLAVDVRADASANPQMDQVNAFLFDSVRELLFNAVKYACVDKARVELRRAGDQHVEVVVSDEGAGFDPARLEGREATVGGFGLFSIRERLSYLGGRMEVASAPGRGSRFTLVAPRRLGAQACAPPAADAAPGQGATRVAGRMGLLFATGLRTRVLLADDHNVVRQGLAALLQEQPDIEIVGQAADGQQAVELARALRPDVVIMDVSMPRLSGIEATRQIVAEWPHVRVIALSMHEEADMATSMKRVGAAAYLTKGGPPEALMEAVRGRPAKGD